MELVSLILDPKTDLAVAAYKTENGILVHYYRWPKCKMVGCPMRACVAMNSEYCHPHTPLRREVRDLSKP